MSTKKTVKKPVKKKEYPVVKGVWQEVLEPEYYLNIQCPHCKKELSEWKLSIFDGERVNKLFYCFHCGKRFKLQVKECKN